MNPTLLISIPPSGKAHSFPLNQVPDLYDVDEIDHFVADTKVIFLLKAANRNTVSDSKERHFYAAIFNQDGGYEETRRLEGSFEVYRLGLFPSGTYLAYGYDKDSESPKVAMLNEDGTILKYLQFRKDELPNSAFSNAKGKTKGDKLISPMYFLGRGHSIFLFQSTAALPILKVDETGAVHEIRPKLPNGTKIDGIIPSDTGLYVRIDATPNSIYELDAHTGLVRRIIRLGEDQSGSNVACVTNGKFLSFEDVEGKFIPLTGTPEAQK